MGKISMNTSRTIDATLTAVNPCTLAANMAEPYSEVPQRARKARSIVWPMAITYQMLRKMEDYG
jgi:hypothetical protein